MTSCGIYTPGILKGFEFDPWEWWFINYDSSEKGLIIIKDPVDVGQNASARKFYFISKC